MGGERLALLVGTDAYTDPGLTRLRAPTGDVRALAAGRRRQLDVARSSLRVKISCLLLGRQPASALKHQSVARRGT
jgi:hypothetical protein